MSDFIELPKPVRDPETGALVAPMPFLIVNRVPGSGLTIDGTHYDHDSVVCTFREGRWKITPTKPGDIPVTPAGGPK